MDIKAQIDKRVKWIKAILSDAGASGVVLGNSGGKDSALVAMLCKKACDKVIGVIMPCESRRNYEEDNSAALELAQVAFLQTITVDLTPTKKQLCASIGENVKGKMALANINPRLRMTVLYSIAQENNCLVAGTGNLSERTMGYFTKFGDGACDFNPIGDLTATEVFMILRYLNAPSSIVDKPPSAALWEGQTDEDDMGVTYQELDAYIKGEQVSPQVKQKIYKANMATSHKRRLPLIFSE